MFTHKQLMKKFDNIVDSCKNNTDELNVKLVGKTVTGALVTPGRMSIHFGDNTFIMINCKNLNYKIIDEG
jgi:hypothetical protein